MGTTKSSLPSLYIHMTLRGGSATAAKIGLSAPASIDSSKTNSSSSSSTSSSSEQKEEKKSSDPPRISPIPIRRQSNPYIAHYYNMQRSYPPNPYNLNSPTLPNMMHPNMMHPHPQTLHRHHSAPPTSAHVSQSFAPPTLVQQTSNPNNSHIAMSYNPYNAYSHFPHVPNYAYPQHSHSSSNLLNGKKGKINFRKKKSQSAPKRRLYSSKKEESEKEEKQQQQNNDDDNAQNVVAGGYGMRQRRNPNNNNANVQNVQVRAVANANNNNAQPNNVFNNVNNRRRIVQNREGWFMRMFRILNINVLIRLGIFMWLFAPNLGGYRFAILCCIGVFYYLHQIGVIGFLYVWLFGNEQRNVANDPVHRDPNAANAEENNDEIVLPPATPLGRVQLLQRFLIGFCFSLWPTWDHRTVYPPIAQ